jgi:hypothetical protein
MTFTEKKPVFENYAKKRREHLEKHEMDAYYCLAKMICNLEHELDNRMLTAMFDLVKLTETDEKHIVQIRMEDPVQSTKLEQAIR